MSAASGDVGSSARSFVQNRTEDGKLKIHGVAIGDNDITRGHMSGEKKLWTPSVLEESAHTLSGKDIVVDHENRSAYKKIGEVTKADYKPGIGVIYQGVISDDELEGKIENEWLDVSPRILHSKSHEEKNGLKVPDAIREFDNLSVVRQGAAPSNTLKPGEHEELSVEELQSFFDDGDAEFELIENTDGFVSELQEGIDMTQYLYKSQNAARGAAEALNCSGSHEHEFENETWFMPCDSHDSFLQSLKQSEEMAISMKPKEGQMVRWQPMPQVIGKVVHAPDDEDIVMVEAKQPESAKGMTFTAGFEDVVPVETSVEEMAEFTEDDYVQWDWSDGTAYGQVTDIVSDGSRTVEGNTRTVSSDDDESIVVIDQVNEEGESQDQRVIKIVREEGENENNLRDWSPSESEEASEIEEMQISEARMPEYDGTEQTSWGEIDADTLSYWTNALDLEAEQTSDLTDSQKEEIAQHTLLGDPDSDNIRSLRFFPVVNAETGNLNRGALEAVRSGRGQSADIPQDTYESAFGIAGQLLNEEFGTDVEEEFSPASFSNAIEVAELEVDQEELDEVYSEWDDAVNMTASELETWSGNGCSRIASVDPEAVIERNLNLLNTPKSEWGEEEIEDANRTISFISRMRPNEPEDDPMDGRFGCPTDWAISLLNWAYNPFDSLPNQPDNDDVEDVEELQMAKHDRAEMKKAASQMSSYTELTKAECMGLMESLSMEEKTDMASLAKVVASAMGMHKDEMQKHLEEMTSDGGESNEDDGSMLNRIVN